MLAIIMPVYNAQKHLRKAIDSIRRQKYQEWKLIAVDDGSTDLSGSYLDEYAQIDSRINVIHQNNQGCIAARKAGILSEGTKDCEYISFCDSDDTMPPNALESMVHFCNEDTDIVCGNMNKLIGLLQYKPTWTPPCLNIGKPETYDHNRIMNQLFISYYGITDFPVSLWAKAFKKRGFAESY